MPGTCGWEMMQCFRGNSCRETGKSLKNRWNSLTFDFHESLLSHQFTLRPVVSRLSRIHEIQEFVMAKNGAEKPMSKTDILNALAESSALSKKQVGAVLDGLAGLIGKSLSKKGPGVFNVPGLMKITVQHKPATKA